VARQPLRHPASSGQIRPKAVAALRHDASQTPALLTSRVALRLPQADSPVSCICSSSRRLSGSIFHRFAAYGRQNGDIRSVLPAHRLSVEILTCTRTPPAAEVDSKAMPDPEVRRANHRRRRLRLAASWDDCLRGSAGIGPADDKVLPSL
jgi:hypothetical protein